MSLGLFGARADHRGLHTLTALMHKCLEPAKTMVVDMGRHSPTVFHDGLYGEAATTITYDDAVAGAYDLEGWLDGLDTVVTFEIPYDGRLFDVCRKHGVKTVCVVMPELDPWVRTPELPRPDVVALPTGWMADRYPDAPVLRVPSDPWTHTHRWRGAGPPVPGDLVVHPSALAMRDRNGTRPVLNASRRVRWPVVVRAQVPPDQPWFDATVEVEDRDDPRALFDGAAIVVVPRRYGGLSLVIQEALSAGLPVLLPETDPYASVVPAEARIRAVEGRNLVAKGGTIRTWDCAPRDVAAAIDRVMGGDELRAEMAKASRRWARANAWDKVRPAWDAVLT